MKAKAPLAKACDSDVMWQRLQHVATKKTMWKKEH